MLYIVRIGIDQECADAWQRWMCEKHVPEVLATGAFAETWMARDPGADGQGRLGYRILYRAHSAEALELYLAKQAPRLRQETEREFGGRFQAQREMLEVVARLVP